MVKDVDSPGLPEPVSKPKRRFPTELNSSIDPQEPWTMLEVPRPTATGQ